ncbi:MAG: YceI family protein [Chromatiales bacterium]|jgi:polyisoprenoid-binding protein YceI|nr:YceI family protein [Chromatiales bacterium]
MRSVAFTTAAVLVAALPFTSSNAAPVSYTVDAAHTYPSFEINHLGFSTIRGRFNSTEGRISLDTSAGTGSVEVTIDAASIDTGFAKRDDHLRSPDFLNTGEFPKITYKSTKVTLAKDTGKVEGNLTINGVTKSVPLEITHFHCGQNPMNKKDACGFDAVATIKRSDFGVTYAVPAVADEMKILLGLEASRD